MRRLTASIAIATLLLVGCGSDTSSNPGPTPDFKIEPISWNPPAAFSDAGIVADAGQLVQITFRADFAPRVETYEVSFTTASDTHGWTTAVVNPSASNPRIEVTASEVDAGVGHAIEVRALPAGDGTATDGLAVIKVVAQSNGAAYSLSYPLKVN